MAGRTWRDLRRGSAGGGVERPAAGRGGQAPDPEAILAGLPRLGPLLEQRQALEGRMSSLLSGPEAAADPREGARFPVMGLPQRRAEYRHWEDRRATSAAEALLARRAERDQPPPPGERRGTEPPSARIARWFSERDEQTGEARAGASLRRQQEAGVRERLDGRTAAARERVAAERAAGRSVARRVRRATASDTALRGDSPARRSDDRRSDTSRDTRAALITRPRAPGDPEGASGAHGRERRGASLSDIGDLGQRSERARERLLGRKARLRRAARTAARVGSKAEEVSARLAQLDERLAEAGMDDARRELKDSGVGRLTRALDRTAELAKRPQRMVERANAQWQRRRDQISGSLPVDRGLSERVRRLLTVDVGSMESFEERMDRARNRALRRRDAQRRQEQREQDRRERARERSQERRREEGRGA